MIWSGSAVDQPQAFHSFHAAFDLPQTVYDRLNDHTVKQMKTGCHAFGLDDRAMPTVPTRYS